MLSQTGLAVLSIRQLQVGQVIRRLGRRAGWIGENNECSRLGGLLGKGVVEN